MENNSAKNKILSNGAFLFFEYFVKFAVGIAVTTWLARHLGPELYGEFSYITSFGLIFITFITLGSDDVITKNLVDKNEASHNLAMGNSFLLRITGSTIATTLGVTSAYIVNSDDKTRVFFISFFLISMFFKSFENVNLWLIAEEKMKGISLTRTLTNLILSGLKIIFIVKNLEFKWLIYISGFEFVVMGILYLFIYQSSIHSIIQWKYDLSKVVSIIKSSFPIFLLMFVMMLTTKIDQLMIEDFRGAKELAYYSVSVKLIDLWQFFPNILLSITFPLMIRSWNTSKEDYENKVLNLYSTLFWSSALLSLAVSLSSSWIISFLYGEKFQNSASLLTWYAWLNVFTFLSLGRLKIFIIENRQSLSLSVAVVTLFSNVFLNYMLIPLYGAKGAIAASIGSHVFSNLVCCIFSDFLKYNMLLYFKSIFTIPKFEKRI